MLFRTNHKHRILVQAVCGEHRVEQADAIAKNAAQACDSGVGSGTQRPMKPKKRGVGPTPAFHGR
jgi:hypothetical protein